MCGRQTRKLRPVLVDDIKIVVEVEMLSRHPPSGLHSLWLRELTEVLAVLGPLREASLRSTFRAAGAFDSNYLKRALG